MIQNKKILVVGAGGFIGGHLVKKLLEYKNSVIAVDIKPKEYWFQDYENVQNYYSMDIKKSAIAEKLQKILIMYLIWLAIWEAWALLKTMLSVCSQY